LLKKVGLLSNSFQQVYSQQKFKKGVIERYKEMRIKKELMETKEMKELETTGQENNKIDDDKNKIENEIKKRNSITPLMLA
jgi:hypothetical protein